MTFTATYDGHVILPERPLPLPAGARVTVSVAGPPAGGRALTTVDYEFPSRHRVPMNNLTAEVLQGGGQPTFIEVTTGADGPYLRRVRFDELPVVPHPTTGEPQRWMAALVNFRPDLSDPRFMVCDVERRLVPASFDVVVRPGPVKRTQHDLPINSPETARTAAGYLHLIRDRATYDHAVALIRPHLPPDEPLPPFAPPTPYEQLAAELRRPPTDADWAARP